MDVKKDLWSLVAATNLVPQDGEATCYPHVNLSPTENQRSNIIERPVLLKNTRVRIATGTNDTIQVLTWRLDFADTSYIINIPASAGTADYTLADNLRAATGQNLSIRNTGGGAGTAALRSIQTEVIIE